MHYYKLALISSVAGSVLFGSHIGLARSSSSSFSKPSVSTSRSWAAPTPTYSRPSSPTFSRPSSQSYSKPTSSPTTSSRQGYTISKPGITSTNTTNYSTSRSTLSRTVTRQMSKSSLASFDKEQAKFHAPPVEPPTNRQAARSDPVWQQYGRNRWRSADDYWNARHKAEANMPPLPSYVQNSSPSYGGYAAAFLGGMLLDHITQPSYAQWAYSHAEDPDVKRWRADMDKQAENNDELKKKLAELDKEVEALKAQNAPKTDKLPDNVDPALVVSPNTAMLATSKDTMGTVTWIVLIVGSTIFLLACMIIVKRRLNDDL